MGKNANFVSHKKSKLKENGGPKLPLADDLVEGEIAINFGKDVETLSIKNESGDVVTFSSDNYYTEKKLGSGFTGENSGVTVTEAIQSLDLGNEVEVNSGDTPTGQTIELWIDESFDPAIADVYTKAETDTLLDGKLDVSAYTPSVELWISGTGMNSAVLKGGNNGASGTCSVAEGAGSKAIGDYSHAEGHGTATGDTSHAEGIGRALGSTSHAEGNATAVGNYSHAEGKGTTTGYYSHAEGDSTTANGNSSHVEGYNTKAIDSYTHAEGFNTIASGMGSHAEGYGTEANGMYSHSEGNDTTASGQSSHAEGFNTKTIGQSSHAEGYGAIASGYSSHAEGANTKANGDSSHAEGSGSKTIGNFSHAEGLSTVANNRSEHASGQYNISNSANTEFGDSGNTLFSVGNGIDDDTRHNAFEIMQNGDIYITSGGTATSPAIKLQDYIGETSVELWESGSGENSAVLNNSSGTASGNFAVAEGYQSSATSFASHAEGVFTEANGMYSHSEGYITEANGMYSHSEGNDTTASGNYSHAEGSYTTASGQASHAEGQSTKASRYSHAEGYGTTASGDSSHAEGYGTTASGDSSHAEGSSTAANGHSSHAEGINTTASGEYSHAEGNYTTANGDMSHAEGQSTQANDYTSHAEGSYTIASGQSSHAEGNSTTARGWYSHAEGDGTVANNRSEHASGQFNISSSDSTTFGNSGNTLFSVGNGTADNARHNAFEIRQNGDIYITSGNSDIRLQDYLGGSSITIDQVIDSGTSASTDAVSTSAVYGFVTSYTPSITVDQDFSNTASTNPISTKAVYSAITDNELVWTNAFVALSGTVSAHTENTDIHVTAADKTAWNAKLDASAYTPSVELWESGSGVSSVVLKSSSGTASGDYAVAEGHSYEYDGDIYTSIASGTYSHTEGSGTKASGDWGSHAEGDGTVASGESSHAEGSFTTASGDYSHAEGSNTTASGDYSHAEGSNTTASGDYSHAEGDGTVASGESSHAEGGNTIASGNYSHAEGTNTIASGNSSHAEGTSTTASGYYSHAEGDGTEANGEASHAEGRNTTANGEASHAEGYRAIANGKYSHAEGWSYSNSDYSHAEGDTVANGDYSHTEGYKTAANNQSEHASGQYNVSSSASTTFGDSGNTLFSVGNGTDDNARHNAFEIRQNGDIYITSGSSDIKLQDYIGSVETVTAITPSNSGSTDPIATKVVAENELTVSNALNDLNTTITAHTADTNVHFTANDRLKWETLNRRTRKNFTDSGMTYFTNTLKSAIADQDLEKYGMKVGDYITVTNTIDGSSKTFNYVIAGLNTMKGTSTPYRLATNHVGLIVDTNCTQAWNASNSTSTSSGHTLSTDDGTTWTSASGAAYANCDLHYYLTTKVLPLVESNLGSDNIKSHSKIYSNAVNTSGYNRFGSAGGCSSSWAWYPNQKICALSEVQVYGSIVWSSSGYDTGEACRQLDVFRVYNMNEIFEGRYPWLRDVASSSVACRVSDRGTADASIASNTFSVAALILFA